MRSGSFLILIAEGNPLDARVIQAAIKKANLAHPVRLLRSGEEVIAYLSGEKAFSDRGRCPLPGVILLDPQLDHNSELRVLEWLKSQGRLKSIPVVILAKTDREQEVKRAYELGATSYLLKPVDADQLVAVLSAIASYWALNEQPR